MNTEPGSRAFDLCAFSDALTDIIYSISSQDLEKLGLQRSRSQDWTGQDKPLLEQWLKAHEALSRSPGGSPANTLSGASRLGSRCVFIGGVGHDDNAQFYLDALKQAGVESRVATLEGRTPVCITFIEDDGERSFAIDLGVTADMTADQLPTSVIAESRMFHTSVYQIRGHVERARMTRQCFEIARQHQTGLSLDLGDAGVVQKHRAQILELLQPAVSFLFANASEARALAQAPEQALTEVAASLSELAQCVVITDASHGCVIHSEAVKATVPALRVPTACDFNGAGDAFSAAFLHAWLHGAPLEQAARAGHTYASYVIQKRGAQYLEPVDDILDLARLAYSETTEP